MVAWSACSDTPEECPPSEWIEGLVISAESPAPLTDGSYQLFVEADGIDLEFGLAIENEVRMCLTGDQPGCVDEVDAEDGRWLHATAGALSDSFSVNLFYTDEGELAGGPEQARLRVLRDGLTLGDQSLDPDYLFEEPAGEGCGLRTFAEEAFGLDGG